MLSQIYVSLICLFTFCSYQEGYLQASKKMENSVLRDFSRRDDIQSCFKKKQDYSHVFFLEENIKTAITKMGKTVLKH